MTTPAGLPIWSGTSSASTYGGHPEKRDYGNIGEVNPETDVSAAQFMRLCADVAAIARMTPVFRMSVHCQDSGTPLATVQSCISAASNVVAGPYSGTTPTGFPSVSRVSNGRFTIVFPSSLTDEYGVAAAVAIEQLHVSLIGDPAGSGVGVQWTKTATNTYDIRILDSSDAAVQNADIYLEAH